MAYSGAVVQTELNGVRPKMKVPTTPITPANETMALSQVAHELREIKVQLVTLNHVLVKMLNAKS